ncbi:hypothetical protein IAR50_003149 [Cryptococcus sp. DSM 104548]
MTLCHSFKSPVLAPLVTYEIIENGLYAGLSASADHPAETNPGEQQLPSKILERCEFLTFASLRVFDATAYAMGAWRETLTGLYPNGTVPDGLDSLFNSVTHLAFKFDCVEAYRKDIEQAQQQNGGTGRPRVRRPLALKNLSNICFWIPNPLWMETYVYFASFYRSCSAFEAQAMDTVTRFHECESTPEFGAVDTGLDRYKNHTLIVLPAEYECDYETDISHLVESQIEAIADFSIVFIPQWEDKHIVE